MMMDWDNITRTGARAPGVKRQIAARTEVLKRIVSPDTERGRDAKAGSTKGGGKHVSIIREQPTRLRILRGESPRSANCL